MVLIRECPVGTGFFIFFFYCSFFDISIVPITECPLVLALFFLLFSSFFDVNFSYGSYK